MFVCLISLNLSLVLTLSDFIIAPPDAVKE